MPVTQSQTPPVNGFFRKLHIAFKYLAIPFFVISLYTFLSSSWLLYKAERISGTVIDIISHTSTNRKSGTSSTSYTPVFEYRYKGEILQHEATFGSGVFTYELHEKVEILVNPDSGTVKANSFLELWFLPLMLAGVGAFFTVFAVVILKIARVFQSSSHFKNNNDNGIPNQIADLFDTINGNKEGAPEMMKAEGNRPLRMNEVNPGTSAWIKMLIVIFIGLLVAFAYLKFSGTDTPTKDEPSADSTRQLTETIDGVPLTEPSVENNEEQVSTIADVFFIIRYQNVEVYDGETLLFFFPLPDGAAVSNSDEHKSQLNLSYPVQEGTNLRNKDFSFTINEGACEPEEDESVTWSDKKIGDIEFVVGSGGGAGAGQYYQTENYSFERYGHCMTFTLELHSSNIDNIDPPVSQFDVAAEISFMENILKGIKFK